MLTTPTTRPLPKGIYTPLPTFFTDDEELGLEAFGRHVQFVARAGTVPVIAGSMGEAPHLTHDERCTLIQTARSSLDACGLASVPIVAGAGTSSTRESIAIAHKCATAGADAIMVIPPGYYAGPLKSDVEALKAFFVDIAAASPVPVMMYNFPAVSGGLDIDSDLVIDVIKQAPNVCGIKLTCANVGKLTRMTATVDTPEFRERYPRKDGREFLVIDGYIDILLPSMASGASGAISGLPNFAPRLCVRLWELCLEAENDPGKRAEARELQGLISLADGYAAKIGIAGMKALLHRLFGYGNKPRRPLRPLSSAQENAVLENALIQKIVSAEKALE